MLVLPEPASPCKPWTPVMGRQHLLNGFPLRRIEKFAAVRMVCGLLFGQNRLDGILPALHMPDRRKFRGNGLAGGELPPCFMLLAVNDWNSPLPCL